jgi:hypothetical protein
MGLLRLPPPHWWTPGLTEAVEQAMAARDEALRQQFRREEQQLIQRQEQRLQSGKARRAAERRYTAARNKAAVERHATKMWGALYQERLEELRRDAEQKRGRHADPARAKSDRDTEDAVVAAINLARERHPERSVRKAADFAFEHYYEKGRPLGLPTLAADSFRTKYYRAIKKDKPED